MFISLKVKALILTSILVLGLSAFFAFIGEEQLEDLYLSQREANHLKHTNVINGLVMRSNSHLQQLADLLPTLTSANTSQRSNQEILNNHWEYLEINWSLESAVLYQSNTTKVAQWGAKNNFEDLQNKILMTGKSGSPTSAIHCQSQCVQVLITPIISPDGYQVLLLTRSLADTLRTFKEVSQADIGILTPTQSTKNKKTIGRWQQQATALTNFNTILPLLKETSQRVSFKDLLRTNQTLELSNGGFQLALIPTVQHSNHSYYIVIEDVSKERLYISSASRSYVSAAVSAVIVFSLLIIAMLWTPIVRLRKQADLMPLLSQGKFEYVRYTLEHGNKNRWFKDEIDILDSSEINVSLQLESMHTQIQKHNEKLQQLALFDTLTGLANRRSLLNEIKNCLGKDEFAFALLFLDLDNFKRINDSLGHQAGDELLQIVSKRIKSCVRNTDLVTRLGGDEFCILIRELHGPEDGRTVATNVLNILKNPIRLQTTEIIVSASIGIVSAPEDGGNTEDLLQNADLAMYQAKSRGKNKFQMFNRSMNEQAIAQLELETELRQALINHEFELFYQPQIDFKTNTICSVEALVRWNHPTRGLLEPGCFIEPLEETGLIVPLGEWVLVESCQALKRWISMGISPIKMSVNLSARQLQDPKLTMMVEQTLSLTNLPATSLELEITESMLMQDIDNNNSVLMQIQSLGVSIAIDDFGTGYSSFGYLKALPLDTLKIDRSFVTDIPENETDRDITAAIIAVAHKLKLEVIAEGIETKEQAEFLISEGCDIGQGYLFSKPLPEAQTIALLHQNKAQVISANDS